MAISFMWQSVLLVLEGFALGTATTFLTMAMISSRRKRQQMRSAFTKKELSRLARFGS
jgi:hypothetical protein